MRRLQHTIRPLLLLLAAFASYYLGAHWPQASLTPPGLAALATERTGTAPVANAPVQRDPSLAAPQRLHVVPAAGGDAFAPVSWLPPPPKAPPPAALPPPPPAAAPTAPPLPFSFVGLLEQGPGRGQPKAFLARGDTLLVVAAGDTLESNYSVDSITAEQITLTYLPLKTRQTLSVTGGAR